MEGGGSGEVRCGCFHCMREEGSSFQPPVPPEHHPQPLHHHHTSSRQGKKADATPAEAAIDIPTGPGTRALMLPVEELLAVLVVQTPTIPRDILPLLYVV